MAENTVNKWAQG
jgi:hypothetical protein